MAGWRQGRGASNLRVVGDSARHWDTIYARADQDHVSWYEDEPSTSSRLVEAAARSAPASLIDVGAGQSRLVDRLLEAGWTDLTLLDVSRAALAGVQARLGERVHEVSFVVADLLEWEPRRRFEVWHDRAVFHFLTRQRDRASYVRAASRAVVSGGALVLGVFAEDGPTRCSGLPTARYDADSLAFVFAEHFVLESAWREEHVTPAGATQPLTWAVLRRR
jgi:SAM-dependent methyltransferase